MEDRTVRVRNFVALQQTGVLSTLSRSADGAPFGSVVQYDVDESGRLIIFISRLAEHFRNLEADPRASVLILDHAALLDPQPFGRATIVGAFALVPDSEQELVATRYFRRFPASSARGLAHDFRFYRLAPERVRWIGGFGDIRWVEPTAYATSAHDPICYEGMAIISHLNIDHQGAVLEIARAATDLAPSEKVALCSGITSAGLTLAILGDRSASTAESGEGASLPPGTAIQQRRIRVAFGRSLNSAQEARSAVIALLQQARAGTRLSCLPEEH